MARIEAKSEVMGVVATVEGKVGERIDAGGTIMFIESMKMQIPILLDDAATLRQVLVKEGDTVSEGQVVAVLET
jgi:acetyl-CoA carboxylase biotin carboxyl carrier protein